MLGDPVEGGGGNGEVNIYERDTNTDVWAEIDPLTASDGGSDDEFGISLAISGDFAVIGAHQDSEAGAYAGAAYVFAFEEEWVEVTDSKLTASDAEAGDQFGFSVDINGDNLVVGTGKGSNEKAYVFSPDELGDWLEVQKLDEVILVDSATVAISGDFIVIGDDEADVPEGPPGVLHVYFNTGEGAEPWELSQSLIGSAADGGHQLGSNLDILGDFIRLRLYPAYKPKRLLYSLHNFVLQPPPTH